MSILIRFKNRLDKGLHPGLESAWKHKRFSSEQTLNLPLRIKQPVYKLLKAKLTLQEAKITLK